MNTQFLTNDGQQHARSQLEYLRTVKRAEVAHYLRDSAARALVVSARSPRNAWTIRRRTGCSRRSALAM